LNKPHYTCLLLVVGNTRSQVENPIGRVPSTQAPQGKVASDRVIFTDLF
jgi:hypothetical protein